VPVTTSGFFVHHSNPEMTSMLGMALDYLQKSPVAAVFIEMASEQGLQIGMNPANANNYPDVTWADPGNDLFDFGTNMVIWNPYSALEVIDRGTGAILGVQSAALGLLHEIVHGLDPALLSNLSERLPGTGLSNQAEFVALQYEAMVASELGELVRTNTRGNSVDSDNPTTHTMPTDSGLIWTQITEEGVSEYGEHYQSPGQTTAETVPDFGSTLEAWENSGGFEPSEPWENGAGFEPADPYADAGKDDPVILGDVPLVGLVAQPLLGDGWLLM
jgi:hypothetical protein